MEAANYAQISLMDHPPADLPIISACAARRNPLTTSWEFGFSRSALEWEVLTLIVRGYTNQKIADSLVIGVGTVTGHVGNILSKLHLADRTQAAVFAWGEGFVRRD